MLETKKKQLKENSKENKKILAFSKRKITIEEPKNYSREG
jgi:hypothetical protein